jgi:hypothetical protein
MREVMKIRQLPAGFIIPAEPIMGGIPKAAQVFKVAANRLIANPY